MGEAGGNYTKIPSNPYEDRVRGYLLPTQTVHSIHTAVTQPEIRPKPQHCNTVGYMRESDLTKTITTLLKQHPNVWVMKTHGSPYMPKGTPDLIGCCGGRFFAIEVKLNAHGAYRATPAQKYVGDQIIKAGGVFTIMDKSNYRREVAEILAVNTPESI